MHLTTQPQSPDLTLHFVASTAAASTSADISADTPSVSTPSASTPSSHTAATGRLSRSLKPGEVRLSARSEERDEALALAPTTPAEAREVGRALAALARELGATTLSVDTCDFSAALAGAAAAAGWQDRRYKGDGATGDGDKGDGAETPGETQLYVSGLSEGEQRHVRGLLRGVTFARELTSAPANVLNPATLAREARGLASEHLEVEIWDESDLQSRSMGLLLAVAAGSETGPRLIRLTLPARGEKRRVIALVGKGVTFDTGGYSLKTAAGMYGMKNDMGGAAAVLGAVAALSELREQVPDGVEVRAYVAAAENMVGPRAMRPGDIYRAACGKTVEVTNTDAEGRLVLADALTVACNEGATEVIDLATLTGVKISALGNDMAALFCNDRTLAAGLSQAAESAGEMVWELPLHRPYLRGYQEGTLADLKNSDMQPAGASIKAALFLQEFVTRPWAHLDIAGNAEKDSVATGWGVGTLVEYVLAQR